MERIRSWSSRCRTHPCPKRRLVARTKREEVRNGWITMAGLARKTFDNGTNCWSSFVGSFSAWRLTTHSFSPSGEEKSAPANFTFIFVKEQEIRIVTMGTLRRTLPATLTRLAVLALLYGGLLLEFSCVATAATNAPTKQSAALLRRRELQQVEKRYPVVLFLQLYYVNNGLASQIEQSVSETVQSNVVSAHFCKAVNEQVRCKLRFR